MIVSLSGEPWLCSFLCQPICIQRRPCTVGMDSSLVDEATQVQTTKKIILSTPHESNSPTAIREVIRKQQGMNRKAGYCTSWDVLPRHPPRSRISHYTVVKLYWDSCECVRHFQRGHSSASFMALFKIHRLSDQGASFACKRGNMSYDSVLGRFICLTISPHFCFLTFIFVPVQQSFPASSQVRFVLHSRPPTIGRTIEKSSSYVRACTHLQYSGCNTADPFGIAHPSTLCPVFAITKSTRFC